MIDIDIVIPSMGRAGCVLTKGAIAHGVLCVPDSQEEEYRDANPEMEIETHPDSVVGLTAKRQWIIEHHKNVFMIDDDIKAIVRMYTEDNSKLDKDEAYDIIQYIGNCAHLAGCYLFGLSKEKQPLAYNDHKPIQLTGIINGSVGILDGGGLYYNKQCILTEDYWMSAYNAYTNRKCWIDTRFSERAGTAFESKGGCSAYRTEEAEAKDTLYLRRLFGEAIQIKKNSAIAKSKLKYMRTLKIPF